MGEEPSSAGLGSFSQRPTSFGFINRERLSSSRSFRAQIARGQAELLENSSSAEIEDSLEGKLDRNQESWRAKGHRHMCVVGCGARLGHCHRVFGAPVNGAEGPDRIPPSAVEKAALPEQNALRSRIIERLDPIGRTAPRLEQRPLFPQAPPKSLKANVPGNFLRRQSWKEERRGRESNPRIEVLQTPTLPLGYPAEIANRSVGARFAGVNGGKSAIVS